MTFYSSKTLSRRFHINLSRWKRWAREFLPPDPLGGYQSGYARQYSLKEAFIVSLGGYMVSGLGFSIPDARQIMNDLDEWFAANHFYASFARGTLREHSLPSHANEEGDIIIHINPEPGGISSFSYRIRTVKKIRLIEAGSMPVIEETYQEQLLGGGGDVNLWGLNGEYMVKFLLISKFYRHFLVCVFEVDPQNTR